MVKSLTKNICFAFKYKSQYYQENKTNHQNSTSNYRQNMVRTKATVRRMDDVSVVAREKKREQKRVNIKENRQVIKTINVKRKSINILMGILQEYFR